MLTLWLLMMLLFDDLSQMGCTASDASVIDSLAEHTALQAVVCVRKVLDSGLGCSAPE